MATSLLCLSLMSCESVEEEAPVVEEPKIEKHEKVEEKKPSPEVVEVLSPLKELDQNSVKLNLPSRSAKEKKTVKPLTYRIADYLKSGSDDPSEFNKKVPINLQLENLPLINAIEAFALEDVLDFEYIVDPGVKGTVQSDIQIEDKLTKYDAWKLFEEVLYMGGAYATVDPGNIIRIMPFTKMPKEKRLLIKGEPKGNVAVELIEILKIPAADIIANIKPFMTDGSSATVLTKANSVLLVETPENMEKLRALIKLLDSEGEEGWPQQAYQCTEIDSATILVEMQNLLPILGFNVAQGNNADPSGIKITSIDRMNVVAFSAPTEEVLKEISKWLKIFDSTDSGEQEKMYSYPVKHGVATDLVDALSTFFPNTIAGGNSTTTSGSGSSTSSRAGSSRSNSGTSNSRTGISAQQLNRRPTTQQTNRPSTTNRRPTTGGTSGQTEEKPTLFDLPLTVFEDARRNKLVIRTTPRVFSMVKAILTHLDAPAMQVMIQVTAVEVDMGDDLTYGFEFAAQAKFGEGTGTISSGNGQVNSAPMFDLETGTEVINPSNGISALLKKAGVNNEFAFAQAVAGESETQLLFCPQILTMNGQEAEINIGQEVPIRLGSSTTDGTVQDNIEYRDTGVILQVTPQISADKNVNLVINTEISSISEDTVEGIASPIINQNTITTQLTAVNNETILLGGIIQKSDARTNSGIPYLKDVPYLGWLFSGTREAGGKKELVLFVKASVVDSRSDYEKMIDRYKEAIKYKKESPELD
ncbi:MAG: hypothetical protein MK132_20645 [Lentisphaerales bacterium]|nr:hypothetical protein [Lentisphaerales bacterium]